MTPRAFNLLSSTQSSFPKQHVDRVQVWTKRTFLVRFEAVFRILARRSGAKLPGVTRSNEATQIPSTKCTIKLCT